MAFWRTVLSRPADLTSTVFCDIHLREITKEMLMSLIRNMCWDSTINITVTSPRGQWVNDSEPFSLQKQTNYVPHRVN